MTNKIIFGHKIGKSLFSPEEISEINHQLDEILNIENRKDFIWKFHEPDQRINRIEYFVNYNDFFKDLSENKRVLKSITDLISEEVVLFKDKINFKYPDSQGFEPHQDITAGWGRYTDYHISVAIPLTNTNKENGAIEFGKPLFKMINDYHEDINIELDYELVETQVGDVILFDSYVPHRSGLNYSKQSRPIVFFTYTLKRYGSFYELYHQDKFENVPPDIYKVKGQKYRSGNTNNPTIFE